jgi:hypothetical protein
VSWAASPGLRLTRWKAWRRGSPTLWRYAGLAPRSTRPKQCPYVKSYGEGPVMIWFLEDYRDNVVLVVRVQHFELSDPAG